MKFKPGESGNPSGRPKGSRNIQTQLIKLLEPHAEQLINKMVEKALEGDPHALRLCIERLLPKAKHNPIESDLLTLEEDNYMETIESILQEMLLGNIASDEGKKIIDLIEEHQNRKRFDSLIHIP
ncbi:DUF5681 domain-containing protein [Legionella pneumophila]|uniref:DUF5681 domain-containing protein n=1 Tax=Legionella pneumophila TaxID=446 RepID=UPI000152763F|nr:DUF5681 domain-containing protein [Legionella pneumophila]HAT8879194.1 hypothetical protein [Legionella pneumophila subsp. pneumophila]ABQ54210.1 hypothetical protein LPC_0212 [Legionella pneumophila str. Corby]ADG23446.1 hypothetical protein lpa_00281 [Legionella pneumophila 2300/99 Alcoy]CZH77383.1 Uncharacterised protein [Legionella pneumophila]CZH84393.1 Uncharacterised protein [Legionella pneumophila]